MFAIKTTGNLVGGGTILLDPHHNAALQAGEILEDNPRVTGPCALVYIGRDRHMVVPVEDVGTRLTNAFDSSRAFTVVCLNGQAVRPRHLRLREGGVLESVDAHPTPWERRNG